LQQAHKDEGCQRESGPGSRMSKFCHCSQSDEQVLSHLQADLSRCVQSLSFNYFCAEVVNSARSTNQP
jgi:hypothetical protein